MADEITPADHPAVARHSSAVPTIALLAMLAYALAATAFVLAA